MIEILRPEMGKVAVRVVGVGNAGGMITRRIARERLQGVSCGVINTALKDLGNCPDLSCLQIGAERTCGHGAGMDPAVGSKAAQEDANRIKDFLGPSDIVFLVAGFGKGTGTGATPVIGELARELGSLTVAFVTTPFAYEQQCHHEIAEEGIGRIKDAVDVYVPLSNQRLFEVSSEYSSFHSALEYMDESILNVLKGIVDILLCPGRMNLDLADLRTLFKNAGKGTFAVGSGRGESRVADAIQSLKTFPFLQDPDRTTARSLLVSLAGGPDMTLREIEQITSEMGSLIGTGAKFAQGIHQDEALQSELRVMVMAAGISQVEREIPEQAQFGEEDAFIRGMLPLRGVHVPGRRTGADSDQPFAVPEDTRETPAYIRRTKGTLGGRN